MTTKVENALKALEQGYVCSQAVLAAYAEPYGLKYNDALKLGTAFGGGIAGTANICGAVTGALMVIGLAHGKTEIEDTTAKEKAFELARDLMNKTQERFGSLACKEILGEDISTREGRDKAVALKLFETTCRDCVAFTIRTLDAML